MSPGRYSMRDLSMFSIAGWPGRVWVWRSMSASPAGTTSLELLNRQEICNYNVELLHTKFLFGQGHLLHTSAFPAVQFTKSCAQVSYLSKGDS